MPDAVSSSGWGLGMKVITFMIGGKCASRDRRRSSQHPILLLLPLRALLVSFLILPPYLPPYNHSKLALCY